MSIWLNNTSYTVRYQQATIFILFVESVKYHNFIIDALRYDKTETGVSIIIEIVPLSS